MTKKIIALLMCLLMVGTAAMAEAVVLSGDAIVDDSVIYYSGSIDSAEEGVYIMNTDGSGVSRIYSAQMALLGAAEGNLLAVSYYEPQYEYALVVLNAMGEKTVVADGYVDHAIAADGRFYWGIASCALDGSDVRVLIDDKTHSYCYYPLTVKDGYYYYLDWAENADSIFFEGTGAPMGACLKRMNLETGAIDVLGSNGASFLGFEGDYVYYSRTSYWMFDNENSDIFEAEVNEGLYRTNLLTLQTEQITSDSGSNDIYTSYDFMKDGVIYGTRYDFSSEDAPCTILRLKTDGSALPDLSIDDQGVMLHALENGLLYASVCNFDFSDDDFIQNDLLYTVSIEDGSVSLINTSAADLLYYTESNPAIGISGGRIFMTVNDTEACAISLKSCALDGSDWITLARGVSTAIG